MCHKANTYIETAIQTHIDSHLWPILNHELTCLWTVGGRWSFTQGGKPANTQKHPSLDSQIYNVCQYLKVFGYNMAIL